VCRRYLATGRFLNPGSDLSGNRYVPWDPIGSLFAPLGLLALFFRRKKRKSSKWSALLVALLVLGVVGMSLAGCEIVDLEATENPDPTQTQTHAQTTIPPTNTPTPESSGSDGGNSTLTPDSPLTPTATPCPTPPVKTNENWVGIVNVLWHEGASSFSGDLTEEVFIKTLWALRSEGKYDPSLQDMKYSEIVQSGRYSARGHYADKDQPWPTRYLNIAKEILSDQLPPPTAFDNEAIYFISTTHFLRLAPKELNGSVEDLGQEITSTNVDMPEECKNGKYCAFPDIRWRNELKNGAVDDAERGINLPKGKYRFWFPTYHPNEYEECYWIGMYFNNWTRHEFLFNEGNIRSNPPYPPPNFDPESSEANDLKCPDDLPR
jgi:hypothetical protein